MNRKEIGVHPAGAGAVGAYPPDTTLLDTNAFPAYGQLLKMLLPRALNFAIHDRNGALLWSADGCETAQLQQLVEDEIARSQLEPATTSASGARMLPLDREQAYVFPLRDAGLRLVGVVALSCEERGAAARSAEALAGLLRPALEVLGRELSNQYSIEVLQRDLRMRDGDLAVVLGEETGVHEQLNEVDDFARLLKQSVTHLGSAIGALLVPEKNIAVYRTGENLAASTASELLNRTHRHLFSLVQVQRRTILMNRAIDTGPLAHIEHRILACPVVYGARRVVGVLAFFKPMVGADFSSREIHLVEMLARRIAQILLHAYDVNTGLLTRPALEKRAANALAQRNESHHVIYVDIDRLHVLNEIYGMHIGDEVIARVAAVLRAATSTRVSAAKISGDRFALFLQQTKMADATALAESLCSSITGMHYTLGTKAVEVSASFGVAPVQPTEHPLSHALASAEAACKAAKDRGRARVEVFEDADHSIIRRVEDVTLIGAIRNAIEQGLFRLEAQPIVDLQTNVGHRHFELLLRMNDADGKSMPPDKFLLAAERYQLAPAIDRWVVMHVLQWVSAHAQTLRNAGASFAINLSGQSLGDDEFLDFLLDQLRGHALAELISFELTETAAVANIVRAETLMRKVRELGHDIALDDFGKGLSSLSYLKSLPVTCVKIDGELIRDLAQQPRSQAMVSAVVQLARAMKLRTTAECIETDAIRQIVTELGVDHAQGYAIGRPRALEQVLQELLSDQLVQGALPHAS
ncbi:MAG: sensor domain-containing phosphodiesterase [Steroidobacteraceae bacterium]